MSQRKNQGKKDTHIITNSNLLLTFPNPGPSSIINSPRNITDNLPQRRLQIRRFGRPQTDEPAPSFLLLLVLLKNSLIAKLRKQEVLRGNIGPRDNQRGGDLVRRRFEACVADKRGDCVECGAVGFLEDVLQVVAYV